MIRQLINEIEKQNYLNDKQKSDLLKLLEQELKETIDVFLEIKKYEN